MPGPANIATRTIRELLGTWLGEPGVMDLPVPNEPLRPESVLQVGPHTFVVVFKTADDIAHVDHAIRLLAATQHLGSPALPLLVVPYMGPKAKTYVGAHHVSWMDLSGNADIRGPGLRILIDGRPNRFAGPGRPASAFSPKASRLARVMLAAPERAWLQHELVAETGLSRGYVSKVVGRLVEDDLIVLQPDDGRLRPRAPATMLDAWAQAYDFSKHTVAKFHAVGRTGPEVLAALAGRMVTAGLDHAATGLAAAWQISQQADFRLTTIFVREPLPDPQALGLRHVEAGENVWIVVPNDDGVFYRVREAGGVQCVLPLQAYIDLAGHPERAKEAATALRRHYLGWGE